MKLRKVVQTHLYEKYSDSSPLEQICWSLPYTEEEQLLHAINICLVAPGVFGAEEEQARSKAISVGKLNNLLPSTQQGANPTDCEAFIFIVCVGE